MVNRAGIATAVVLLVSMASGVLVAAPAPTGGVRIESLTHDARRPLRAGDSFTVTLRGSIGASATFDIFGVASDVRMREARPGVYGAQPAVYAGTYTVRPGDAARQAAVFATLKVGSQEVIASADRAITIDTRPPEITSLQPRPETRLANIRPNIVATFFDGESSVNPGAVRLLVNGKNVTAEASITETSVSYNPPVPFDPGPVRVELTVSDRAGNTERTNWTFTIAPSDDLIKSVTINPATPLKSGDVLTLVMTGVPGGEAAFTIEGLPSPVPLRESRTPGLYFGTYEAQRGQQIVGAAILVTLVKEGRRSTAAATTGVTILSVPPPAPAGVSSSRVIVAGARPATRIVLRGRSRPGYRILGRIAYETRAPLGEDQGALQEFLTRVGNDGTWQAAIGPFVPVRAARFLVTVVAIDPAGQQSPPVVIQVSPE